MGQATGPITGAKVVAAKNQTLFTNIADSMQQLLLNVGVCVCVCNSLSCLTNWQEKALNRSTRIIPQHATAHYDGGRPCPEFPT